MEEIESINDAIFYTYFGFNNYDKTWIFKCVQSWRTLLKLLKSSVFLYIKSPTGKLSKMQSCICMFNHVNLFTCFVTCVHPLQVLVCLYTLLHGTVIQYLYFKEDLQEQQDHRDHCTPCYAPWVTYSWRKKVKVYSLSHVYFFSTTRTVAYEALLPMGFSRQEYWMGCHFLLQGIFATQGLNPGLPHCRQTLYRLSHQGSPSH